MDFKENEHVEMEQTVSMSDLRSINEIIDMSNKQERKQVFDITKTMMYQDGKLCIKSKVVEKAKNKPKK